MRSSYTSLQLDLNIYGRYEYRYVLQHKDSSSESESESHRSKKSKTKIELTPQEKADYEKAKKEIKVLNKSIKATEKRMDRDKRRFESDPENIRWKEEQEKIKKKQRQTEQNIFELYPWTKIAGINNDFKMRYEFKEQLKKTYGDCLIPTKIKSDEDLRKEEKEVDRRVDRMKKKMMNGHSNFFNCNDLKTSMKEWNSLIESVPNSIEEKKSGKDDENPNICNNFCLVM
jgi:hypothetical protein